MTDSIASYQKLIPNARLERKNKALFIKKTPIRRRLNNTSSDGLADNIQVHKGEIEMKTLLSRGSSSKHEDEVLDIES